MLLGVSTPEGPKAQTTIRPSGLLFKCVLSIFTLLGLRPFFFDLFQPFCSHAQVFGRILVHEFHIFYSHIERNVYPFALQKQWELETE